MRLTRFLIVAAAALACLPLSAFAKKGEFLAYVGTYTRGDSKGIYAYRFDAASGKMTPVGLVGETSNASFLAVHPNHRFLYAVNENNTFEGQPGGSVSAFAMRPRES
jgi:6-phosphogluconolactonase